MDTAIRYRVAVTESRRLTQEDWARAALDAIPIGGIDGVSVEGLARQLRVTKGSFYWHFADRTALIVAALELWERLGTVEVIDHLRTLPDPAHRLRELFKLSFQDDVDGPIDAALIARIDDPTVGPVVRRVTRLRIDFLEEAYRDLGLSPSKAATRARITYCTYVGHCQVRRAVPQDPVLGSPTSGYLRQLLGTLVES